MDKPAGMCTYVDVRHLKICEGEYFCCGKKTRETNRVDRQTSKDGTKKKNFFLKRFFDYSDIRKNKVKQKNLCV